MTTRHRWSWLFAAAALLAPLLYAQDNSRAVPAEEEAALRVVVERFFAAYEKEEMAGFRAVWSARAPDLATQQQNMARWWKVSDFRHAPPEISRVQVEGDTARLRASVDRTETVTRSLQIYRQRLVHNFTLVKEEGTWKVWRYTFASQDLAAAVAAARDDAERRKLIAEEEEAAVRADVPVELVNLGRLTMRRKAYTEAIATFHAARTIAEQVGDRPSAAAALSGIAEVYRQQARYEPSLEFFQQSLALSEARDDKTAIARTACDVGTVLTYLGQHDRALEILRKSLQLAEARGEMEQVTRTLWAYGRAYQWQGNNDQALKYFQQSLAQKEAQGIRAQLIDVLESLGFLYQQIGDYASALLYFQKGLTLAEKGEIRSDLSPWLLYIGTVHGLQGNHDLELEYARKSLALDEARHAVGDMSEAWNAIGIAHRSRGEYDRALEAFQQCLVLRKADGEEVEDSNVLRDIGMVYRLQGDSVHALEYYRKSLANLQPCETPYGRLPLARTLIAMATLYRAQSSFARALECCRQGLAIAETCDDTDTLVGAYTAMGEVYQAQGRHDAASAAYRQAVARIEGMRTHVAGGEREQERYFEDKVAPYRALVEVAAAQHKTTEALTYAERAKARVLLDVLQSGRARITKAMTAEEQEQERGLERDLIALNTQLTRERGQKEPDSGRMGELNARLQAKRREHEAWQASLYAAHPALKGRRGEVRPVTPLQARALLPGDKSALLEFVVTDTRGFLFVLTRERGLLLYPLDLSLPQLAQQVTRFRDRLAQRDPDFRADGRRLYQQLLGAARGQLQGKTTLIIAPDGPLWELPFQALPTGADRYLVEDAALSYTPSWTLLREMRKSRTPPRVSQLPSPDSPPAPTPKPHRPRPIAQGPSPIPHHPSPITHHPSPLPTRLLAVGNPALAPAAAARVRSVYRDADLAPLPEAEREVRTLARLYGPEQCKVYVGAAAQEARVKADAGRARIVHLATHGVLDDHSPLYSHVVLSQSGENPGEDGLLEAWEMMKLDLHADLVVLSACETARGHLGAGEGVIGMTWALFVAGCPTTVASQWKVDAGSTARLMVAFHRRLQPRIRGTAAGIGPAGALREAQLALLRGRDRASHHPFYWAGFAVIGDGE